MHIVLVNQYYAPDEAATAQLLADVGEHLAECSHRVTAICCNRSYADPARRYPSEETIRGVRVRRVYTTSFGRKNAIGRLLDYACYALGAAFAILRCDEPDVVLSLTTPPMVAFIATTAGRIRGAKSVMWAMDVYPDVLYALGRVRSRSMIGRALHFLAWATARRQHAIVALGESMAKRIPATTRVEVVHNWSDENAIAPLPVERSRTRALWGWADRFVVLYSGNLGLAHEFHTVTDAAHSLSSDRDVLFAFVGSGPRLNEVEKQRDELRLSNVEVRRPVPRAELADVLVAGDVHLITLDVRAVGLVVPSKLYGILAAGRPTIYVGPAEGEVFDIITRARCGTRVANGDVNALVEAIHRYRNDVALRFAEGARARDVFESRFTKRRGVEQFRAIVESL